MFELLSSDAYHAREQQALAGVAAAFNWPLPGQQGEGEDHYALSGAHRRALLGVWENRRSGQAIRPQVEKKIFHAVPGRRDPLEPGDARVMPIIDAMVERYWLCLHWNDLSRQAWKAGEISAEQHVAQNNAVELVRAENAAYYSALLKEEGYTASQIAKIVGNAIYGYVSVAVTQNYPRQQYEIRPHVNGEMSSEKVVGSIVAYEGRLYDNARGAEKF